MLFDKKNHSTRYSLIKISDLNSKSKYYSITIEMISDNIRSNIIKHFIIFIPISTCGRVSMPSI